MREKRKWQQKQNYHDVAVALYGMGGVLVFMTLGYLEQAHWLAGIITAGLAVLSYKVGTSYDRASR